MQKIFLLSLIAQFVCAMNCSANDSVGTTGIGGINFKKTNDISMEKESLTISLDKIRVEYEFLNHSKEQLRETILFPMPPYMPGYECAIEPSKTPSKFRVWVNGIEIKTSVHVRAESNGKDVTDRLRKLGLTDKEIVEYPYRDSCRDSTLSVKEKLNRNLAELIREDLVSNKDVIFPGWSASYVYSWMQDFPPGRKVYVAHEYEPSKRIIGNGVSAKDPSHADWHVDGYCTDDGTIRTAQKINKRTGKLFNAYAVKYILTTGANWNGPIKDFTLNLKKANDDQIVSLCFPGKFIKSDSLTLTTNISNFLPTKEVEALFYFPFPVAQSGKVVEPIISVDVSANVSQQLNSLSTSEKKRIEQAILIGNRYLPQHFDGSAYWAIRENQQWLEDTGPLVAIGIEGWHDQNYAYEDEIAQANPDDPKTITTATRLVCPKILLSEITAEKEGAKLTYRAMHIGKVVESNFHRSVAFSDDGQSSPYFVTIELNKNNLITKVTPSSFIRALSYKVEVDRANEHLNDFKKFGYREIDTKENQDAQNSDYIRFISKAEEQASRICR